MRFVCFGTITWSKYDIGIRVDFSSNPDLDCDALLVRFSLDEDYLESTHCGKDERPRLFVIASSPEE